MFLSSHDHSPEISFLHNFSLAYLTISSVVDTAKINIVTMRRSDNSRAGAKTRGIIQRFANSS